MKKQILTLIFILSLPNIVSCEVVPFTPCSQKAVQKIYQAMLDLHDFFTLYNISYFIDGGTLLGAVRNRGLIPWDGNLDLCIFEEDEQKFLSLFSTLKNLGYEILRMPYGYKIYPDDGEAIKDVDRPWKYPTYDIVIVKKDEDQIFYRIRFNKERYGNLEVKISDVFPLRTYMFGPLMVMGPRNPIPYLNNWYEGDYLKVAHWYYDHATESRVKKTTKQLEPEDCRAALPYEPLQHRIVSQKILEWPIDFTEYYKQVEESGKDWHEH